MDVCFQYLMVLAREQQWEQMLDFFRQLMERSRPPPNENCFGAVLYGLNAAGRWEETVSVMDSFRLRQVDKPKRGVYLSALSTLLKVVGFCLVLFFVVRGPRASTRTLFRRLLLVYPIPGTK